LELRAIKDDIDLFHEVFRRTGYSYYGSTGHFFRWQLPGQGRWRYPLMDLSLFLIGVKRGVRVRDLPISLFFSKISVHRGMIWLPLNIDSLGSLLTWHLVLKRLFFPSLLERSRQVLAISIWAGC
jgi:hypothetical protein